MSATSGNSAKGSGPEPPKDDGEDDLDISVKLDNLEKLIKQVKKDQKDAAQGRIDAVKREYGELKDATDLLYVSFEEP